MTTADPLAQGWKRHQARDYAGAEQLYRSALEADPQDANGWCYLGMACHDQDRLDEAVAAYRRALAIQPKFPVALNNLGNTFRLQRRLADAVRCFDQALALKPDYVNALRNKGTALVWEGYVPEALACYRQALRLAPEDAETHKNIGVIQLLLGEFEEGWREYAWRWKTGDIALPSYSQPLWDGSSLDGKTILLTAEQGLGDTIHFVRYAAALKGAFHCRVIVACQPRLLPLLKTCPGIDQLVSQTDAPPPFDVFSPLLNVPGIRGDRPATFPAGVPYLAADPRLVQAWCERLSTAGGLRVGLMWQGNRDHQADRMRSFPLRELAPLTRLRGIQLFSLQKGSGGEQIEDLCGLLDVIPLGDSLDEQTGAFEETAAVLENLDLVICCDSSLAHLAGALGRPVWLALSRVPDWRWGLAGETTPWYPATRLFRQSQFGDWSSVFAAMAERLPELSPQIAVRVPEDYRLVTSGPNRLARGRRGAVLYNRFDRYIGRSIERYGEFSEGEAELFRQVLRPGQLAVEAGAHIGIHTVALARAVGESGEVIAFEPQRLLFQILCGNLALQGLEHVQARPEALGEAPGWIYVPTLDYRSENNFGGLSLGGHSAGERVRVSTIDELDLPRCDLIKVDVEGMEEAVLQGARATLEHFRPVLYVENDRQDRSPSLIAFLQRGGYRLFWHLPPLFSPDNFYRNAVDEFPHVVSVNMLGVHRSVKSEISGLREIAGPDSDWRQKGVANA